MSHAFSLCLLPAFGCLLLALGFRLALLDWRPLHKAARGRVTRLCLFHVLSCPSSTSDHSSSRLMKVCVYLFSPQCTVTVLCEPSLCLSHSCPFGPSSVPSGSISLRSWSPVISLPWLTRIAHSRMTAGLMSSICDIHIRHAYNNPFICSIFAFVSGSGSLRALAVTSASTSISPMASV